MFGWSVWDVMHALEMRLFNNADISSSNSGNRRRGIGFRELFFTDKGNL